MLCMEDGVNVAEDSCVRAGIGEAPSSETICCPAADEDTCEQSAAEVTAPPAPAPVAEAKTAAAAAAAPLAVVAAVVAALA